MPKKIKTFEGAMLELEELTKSLESGHLTLDENIKSYKKGMELAMYCNTLLKKAEQEIYVLEQEDFVKTDEDFSHE